MVYPVLCADAEYRGARSTFPWTAANAAATPYNGRARSAMAVAAPCGSATLPW